MSESIVEHDDNENFKWIAYEDFEMYFWKKTGEIDIGLLTPEDETQVGEVIVRLPNEFVTTLKEWMKNND